MENHFTLCYSKSHETSRKPDATGEAAPTSDPVAGEGHDLVGGGRTGRLLSKFRFSMAADLSKGRRERAELQGLSGSSFQAFGTGEEAIGESFAEGRGGFWLQHRSLDHAPGGRGDSQVFWDSLSSQSSLATSDGVRVELSEAGTAGSGKRRGGDRTLEKEALAGNKKKPSHLEPIWPFSMKVGFFSSPMYVGHGRRGDRLPSCIIFTGETGSLPSPVSPSRPSGDAWGSTSDFRGKISIPLMWRPLCAISCDIFGVRSSSCGTRLSSIGENPFVTSWIVIHGSIWNGSLDMPLNSIR